MKEVTKEDIYKAFHNVEHLLMLFNSFGKTSTIGGIYFEKVAGDSTDPSDEDISEESRFAVWKAGNLFIKLTGVVTSYGDRNLQRWEFVEAKEKLIVVYE